MTDRDFPLEGKLQYVGEEVTLRALGVYSDFGNSIQPVPDRVEEKHPEIQSERINSNFVVSELAELIQDEPSYTTIDEILTKTAEKSIFYFKYETSGTVFVVVPKLKSVYNFHTQDSEPLYFIQDSIKSLPVSETPHLNLIGEMKKQDQGYIFTASGLKMILFRKSGEMLSLEQREPINTYDYYSEYL